MQACRKALSVNDVAQDVGTLVKGHITKNAVASLTQISCVCFTSQDLAGMAYFKSAVLDIEKLQVQIPVGAVGEFSSPLTLIQCLFHPCVTEMAHKIPQSFCQY